LMGLEGRKFASGWNFGPRDDDALPVATLVQKLAALWGEGATYSVDTTAQVHEATFLKLDCSRARALLEWQPRLGIDSALAWTVEWHKAKQAGANMREVTAQQINRFAALSL
jgi:CDP-glucose 4,6-dehydratase